MLKRVLLMIVANNAIVAELNEVEMVKDSKDKQASFGYCTQCGKPLQAGAKFCTNCGSPVLPVPDDEIKLEEAALDADLPTVPQDSLVDSLAQDETAPLNNQAAQLENEATQQIPISEQPTISSAVPFAAPVENTSNAFTPGNTAELPVAETLRQTAHQGVSYSAEDPAAKKLVNGKTIAIIVGVVVVLIAAAIAVAVLVFGVGQPTQETNPAPAEQTQSQQEIVVELTDTYSTKFASKNSVTYPTFTFKYPSSWSVTDELVTARGETVELTSSDGVVVKYEQRAQSTSSADSVSLNNMEKVADAAFVPTAVQGSNYSDLGDFMVAKGTLSINGSDEGICYALVPASAMHSTMDLDLRCGVPGFWYASTITFTCQPAEGISDQTEQEIIAILASFKESKAAAEPEDKNADNNEVATITDDYVLPDSSSRTYSESELKELTNYELYIARNEIFARHGRMFNNEDLKEYFSSKDWYKPTVSADEFDESVFNSAEKKNIETMAKIENERGSKFIS